MVEVYWQALTRDVPFDTFSSDPTIAAAAAELSSLSDFRGPKSGGAVTPGTIFRGPTAGDLVGPYLSQLLWKPFNYGPFAIDQRVRVAAPGVEYMTDYDYWLAIQNGGAPGPQQYVGTSGRYVITGRDLTEWVHRDFSHQGGTNAVFILLASGVPLAPGNPYLTSATQAGNFTLGTSQILDLVASVANLSLQACWFQKWSVHRRVRPEAFAGNIHNRLKFGRQYPIHADVLGSAALKEVQKRYGGALLPMAYTEGSPVHPSYPAGHATFAGAWATVLKAFFNTNAPILNPEVPDATGANLVPYLGDPLTAGNEIDKLASNISIGRDAAGVHWRTDGEQGMNLGEQVAIRMLQDVRRSFNESFVGFAFTKFDGTPVTI
jgi:PAP2 superfamily